VVLAFRSDQINGFLRRAGGAPYHLDERTLAEIAARHEVRQSRVTAWNAEHLEKGAVIFGAEAVANESERAFGSPPADRS
jgi:hypothetical protein